MEGFDACHLFIIVSMDHAETLLEVLALLGKPHALFMLDSELTRKEWVDSNDERCLMVV